MWRSAKLPFELTFFHQGLYYNYPVRLHEIAPEGVRDIRFDPELFDYGANTLDPKALSGLGYAGFRVHYSINSPKYKDEVLVFLGASYFRALGQGQRYGLSARGLAIDTALMSGEEFPRFTEFWIERPEPQARELRLYALLDSPRADRRVSFRAEARAGHGDRGARATLPAAERRKARPRAADEHVLFRREPARRHRRLPARSARLGRPVDPERHRRMDLASARQSEAAARHVVRGHQSARLRPAAARPQLRRLRGPGGALRDAPVRLDRAEGQMGRRARRARADPDTRRDQRQHRRVLGRPTRRRRRSSRSTSNTGCCGRRTTRRVRRSVTSRRRAAATATCASPTTAFR